MKSFNNPYLHTRKSKYNWWIR